MRLSQFISAGTAAIAFAACSPASEPAGIAPGTAASDAIHPVSGLEIKPLAIHSDGGVHAFQVEVARTPQEQAKGLMFRTEMRPNEGMLFPLNPAREAQFWMKNTVISLDIVFIGTDGRILNIAENTTPYSEAGIPSAGPVKAVLELNGGRVAELGVQPGDRVEW